MDLFANIDWNAALEEYWPVLLGYGLKAVGALIVLILGLRVAGWVAGTVRNLAVKRPNIDDTLGSFFASIVRWMLTAATLIAALQLFGVQATSFVAILGAMTLAIGLSLQGALGNIASGIMIMLFRPYSVGQYVELAGEGGTVKDISLFQTILASPDNVQIIVPNSQAISGVIKNYAGYPTRRIDLVFGIDYGDGIENAIGVIERTVKANAMVLADPAPVVRVNTLGASSVDIIARPWVKTDDYWEARWALTQAVKEALDAAGISIPYPHQVNISRQAG
ncbi:MAG: mechanosensitive ion channel [Hyphomonas sp.]|uniref:mechanosensitive ion channel family protein n=1 Tax=Hyphomonas sp. TaxID=87 RepID=UPI003526FB8F